jgi:hypothetical protein
MESIVRIGQEYVTPTVKISPLVTVVAQMPELASAVPRTPTEMSTDSAHVTTTGQAETATYTQESATEAVENAQDPKWMTALNVMDMVNLTMENATVTSHIPAMTVEALLENVMNVVMSVTARLSLTV